MIGKVRLVLGFPVGRRVLLPARIHPGKAHFMDRKTQGFYFNYNEAVYSFA
jgi:hypothetical protein